MDGAGVELGPARHGPGPRRPARHPARQSRRICKGLGGGGSPFGSGRPPSRSLVHVWLFAQGVVQAVRQPCPQAGGHATFGHVARPSIGPGRPADWLPQARRASGIWATTATTSGGCGEHLPNGGRGQSVGPPRPIRLAVQALKPGTDLSAERAAFHKNMAHAHATLYAATSDEVHLRASSELPRGAGADAGRPHGVVQPGRARVQPRGGGDEGAGLETSLGKSSRSNRPAEAISQKPCRL